MKNLLVVDDEKNFLLSLADMFRHYDDQFTLHTAYNGLEAIEVLDREKIDLVVTDLKMPEMDGFGLLAHMAAAYPSTPVIVMTAFATPENTNRLDTLGFFQYIEKPIEFNFLHDKIKETLTRQTQGHVAGVSLTSFLQLVGLDNKTCTLRITSNNRVGVFYFKDGEIMDAICGQISGEEAAIEIAAWNPVEIYIEESCRKDEKVIDSPLGFILIEGARRKDEKEEAPTAVVPDSEQSQSRETLAEEEPFIDLAEENAGQQEDNVPLRPDLPVTIDKISSALNSAIGPISETIMRDTLDSWEKSDSTDAVRLNDLVDTLCMEIGDSKTEISFRSAVKPALSDAGITPINLFSEEKSAEENESEPVDDQELAAILPKIQKAFMGTTGPAGAVLMKETLEKWGKQGPRSLSRLDELVDLLCTEIEDQDLEHFFRLKIAKML